MKTTDIPKLMAVPFGVSGQREDLLDTPVSGDNTASYSAGFPSITMVDIDAGGKPPKGQDFNQILYELANGLRWSNAGRLYQYDASWSSSNNGYPQGAMLLATDNQTIYMSSVDDNTSDPNSSSSSGWVNISNKYLQVSNNLSEISSSGATAQTSAQKNIGIADSTGYIGRLVNVQIITASGTYTKTSGVKKIRVMCQGAGGAGGGAKDNGASGYASAAWGGSAGSYGETTLIDASSISTVSVNVGTGGAGNSTTSGGNGGVSNFGGYISSPGGSGGYFGNSTNITAPSTGSAVTSSGVCIGSSVLMSVPGKGGLSPFTLGTGSNQVASGAGGDAMLGFGGGQTLAGATSRNGSGYGGGGSGASAAYSVSQNSNTGGTGANGIIIVLEYI